MMFKFSFCLPDFATAIDRAVETVLTKGIRTADIGGHASTVDMGDAIASELTQILQGFKK